ncbi:MAG: transcription antitermination factor NusB [Fretibacterium sp.]|nr:transcription antitermination factor NusB [Fretibacterium sp.]
MAGAGSRVPRTRRRARELAVQLLYSLDRRPGQDLTVCLNNFLSESETVDEGGAADEDVGASGEPVGVRDYLRFLVTGAWERRAEADGLMLQVITGWRPDRMVSVDLAVLRLALFEGFLERVVPFAVAISEAVELAQLFGTEDSGRFVNGVLARVLRHVAPSEGTEEKEEKRRKRTKRTKRNDSGKGSQVSSDS